MASIKGALISFWVDRRGDCGRFYDSMVANGFSRGEMINDALALAVLATVELSHSECLGVEKRCDSDVNMRSLQLSYTSSTST